MVKKEQNIDLNRGIKRDFIINVIISIIYQIVTLICGLILPRAYLTVYGSDVNGMISSINQFLSYIAILQAGVGGVVRAALYKPLAEKDEKRISGIIKASNIFFRKIGIIFVVYAILLSFIYPMIVKTGFNEIFVGSMVIILSISIALEYLFSITWSILLQSDQKRYIFQFVQGSTLIINTVIAYSLIMNGVEIRLVKLATALIFILRPVLLNIYVKRHYNIWKNIEPDKQAIKQKWDALGHHIAFFVRGNTDIFLASFFLDIKLVSVYAVYSFVVRALSEFTSTVIANIESVFGNMHALKKEAQFEKTFYIFDILSKMLTNIVFSTAMIMVVPFVNLYTSGVQDITYERPVFSILFLLSESVYCMGLVYNNLINATGNYRLTKKYAFIEAGINFFGSLLIINTMALEGIVFVTLIAVLYRCVVNLCFIRTKIFKISKLHILKTVLCNLVLIILSVLVSAKIKEICLHSYTQFVFISTGVVICVASLDIIINLIFFKNEMNEILNKMSQGIRMILHK